MFEFFYVSHNKCVIEVLAGLNHETFMGNIQYMHQDGICQKSTQNVFSIICSVSEYLVFLIIKL